LRRADITLTLATGRKYQGRVEGDRMQAATPANDKPAPSWHANRAY